MFLRKRKTWLLLAYLVLLLNLGPSLHRAEFLGFHHHHSHVGAWDSGHDCCHSHNSCEQGQPAPAQKDVQLSSDHDCMVCKFFDQYHVALSFQLDCHETIVHLLNADIREDVFSQIVPSVARGPPVA